MGYGYGIWLLIEQAYLQEHLGHLGHVTLICNMSKDDMISLYNVLYEYHKEKYNGDMSYNCVMNELKGVIFENNMYSKTDKELAGWGYYCEIEEKRIEEIEKTCKEYVGDIPGRYHVTMEYKETENELKVYDLLAPEKVKCKIVMADIRDDKPCNWSIITMEEIVREEKKANVEKIRGCIRKLFEEHEVRNVCKVDYLMEKYKDKEESLLLKIYKKYKK